jgi:hypothetical protein
MSDDEDVGYKKPPKSGQFKKGICPNPSGRRGKEKKVKPGVVLSDAEILRALDSEHIEYHGRQIPRREFELRMLQAKALKGELAAAKHLESLRQSSGQREAAPKTGGVLLLPAKVPLHEWEASVAIQQAKYRSSEDEE